jgi:hypothetical protein
MHRAQAPSKAQRRFVDIARNQIRWRTNRLTKTTYSVPSSSSRSSPTYRFGLYGGSNTSLRFSFSLSRRSRSKCGVGMSGFCSSAGHSLISNYTKKRVFYWFRADLGLAMGRGAFDPHRWPGPCACESARERRADRPTLFPCRKQAGWLR